MVLLDVIYASSLPRSQTPIPQVHLRGVRDLRPLPTGRFLFGDWYREILVQVSLGSVGGAQSARFSESAGARLRLAIQICSYSHSCECNEAGRLPVLTGKAFIGTELPTCPIYRLRGYVMNPPSIFCMWPIPRGRSS
jgi:hypothetical protein